jgi:hypothetical protein
MKLRDRRTQATGSPQAILEQASNHEAVPLVADPCRPKPGLFHGGTLGLPDRQRRIWDSHRN